MLGNEKTEKEETVKNGADEYEKALEVFESEGGNTNVGDDS